MTLFDWPLLFEVAEPYNLHADTTASVWLETLDGIPAVVRPRADGTLPLRKWLVSVDPATGLAWTWCADP